MSDRVDDDLRLRDLVEHKIRERRRRHTTDDWISRAAADIGMQQQEIDQGLDAGLNPPGAPRRMGGDIIKNPRQIGKSWKGVAKPQRPCLAHAARTCSSVANSPRVAAAFDAAIRASSVAARRPVA